MSIATSQPVVAARLVPKQVRQARIVFAALALQFTLPAISYLVSPVLALATMDQVNRMLGDAPYIAHESTGHLWHMLAVGNVATLGFMCAILAYDLERFGPALPALLFLKAFSALFSLGLALTGGPRFFFGVFALDGLTCVVMFVFGRRGLRALAQRG